MWGDFSQARARLVQHDCVTLLLNTNNKCCRLWCESRMEIREKKYPLWVCTANSHPSISYWRVLKSRLYTMKEEVIKCRLENELFVDANRWKWNSSGRACDVRLTLGKTTTARRTYTGRLLAIQRERNKQTKDQIYVLRFHGNRIHFSSFAWMRTCVSVFNGAKIFFTLVWYEQFSAGFFRHSYLCIAYPNHMHERF